MRPLVIVGAGIAGVTAAGSARAAGWEGDIVLIGAEQALPYRRTTVSKELIRGVKGPDQVRIKPESWYDDQRIDLRLGTRVTTIDPDAHRIGLDHGRSIEYERVLLATGGEASTVARDGAWPTVTLRHLDDAMELRRQIEGARRRVVVIGGGLIGAEIASSLRAGGHHVVILEAADQLLARVLPAQIARGLLAWHEAEGTEVEFGVNVASVQTVAEGGLTVTADDGRIWEVDLVVESVGMRPSDALARQAGCDLYERGGVLVDELGRTSVADVYAAGDVAAVPRLFDDGHERIEHWQHAQNHAKSVGAVLAGHEGVFREVPWCWSDQCGTTLQITGWPAEADDMVVRGDVAARDFTALLLTDGRLRGAISVDRPRDVKVTREAIGRGARPDRDGLDDDRHDLRERVGA